MTGLACRGCEAVQVNPSGAGYHGRQNPYAPAGVSTKCDNLWTLDGGPLLFCSPVREVLPPRESCVASGGGFQSEAFLSIQPQIYTQNG